MAFPLLRTVQVHSYSPGDDDGYGNPTRVYNPPLDEPGSTYRVAGWADLPLPGRAEETGNKDRVISIIQLLAPDDFPAGPYDLIDIDGEQWEVDGEANRYSRGLWWNPGLSMWMLKKVAG